jgi:DNA invertase Pin-like site-specific DNA recombinase
MAYFGYIRISTDAQNTEAQKYSITNWAEKNSKSYTKIFEIAISSRKSADERGINMLLSTLQEGDTLVVSELSRLGRNMLETLNIVQAFMDKKIDLEFVKQPELSSSNTSGLKPLLIAIYGYIAQTEREFIRERTLEGLRSTEQKGTKLGRPKGSFGTQAKTEVKRDEIIKLHKKGLSKLSIAKITEVSRPTIDRILKEVESA